MYYIDSNVKSEYFLNKKIEINLPKSFKEDNQFNGEFSIRKIQEMIDKKELAFDEGFLSELNELRNHSSRRFKYITSMFHGRTIGIIDGDYKGLVQNIFYLFDDNKIQHELFYTLKNEKTNEFYILSKKEYDLPIYLSSEDIFDLYKKNKNELFNLKLVESIENYRHSFIEFKSKLVNKNGISDLESVIIKTYPFYEKKINDLITNNNQILLEDFFYKDYLMPFLKYLKIDSFFADNFEAINEETLKNIIIQKSDITAFKQVVPYANKDTMELFELIILSERNLGRHECNEYLSISSFNLSILDAFRNTERLNSFLSYIHSSNNEDNYIYFYKESEECQKFYQEILPSFYSSQIKYENNLIKTLKKYLENVESDLNKQQEDYDKGLEELICECDEEDFCECESDYHTENHILGNNNFLIVKNLMEDSFKSYHALLTLYDKQTSKVKEKIDLILSKKINDIELIHNELADMVSELSNDKIEFPKSLITKNEVVSNDVELFEVLDNIILKKVGREMHHCVASYERQIITGETSIFAIKKDNDFVGCLELKNNIKSLVQAKGKYNMKIIDNDVMNVIELFVSQNRLDVRTSDIRIATK